MSEANDVNALVKCGFCKNCKWRNENRYCMNEEKIDEDYGQGRGEKDDRMIYSYMESGCFEVGDNFGCVHFEPVGT